MHSVITPWTIVNVLMMTNKRLYIDMDGVLADFWTRMCELHPELAKMPEEETRKEYVDSLLRNHSPNVFVDLLPMEGAMEAFNLLAEHYEVYILSTPSVHAPKSYTHKFMWCRMWLGDKAHKKLILSHNKGLLKGDYLVDDRIANGVDQFEGEHIHFGTNKFLGWKEVIEYLREKDNW